jgi:hypothetical protein
LLPRGCPRHTLSGYHSLWSLSIGPDSTPFKDFAAKVQADLEAREDQSSGVDTKVKIYDPYIHGTTSVVNMSWGEEPGEFETWLSKTRQGPDAAERKKQALELFEICYGATFPAGPGFPGPPWRRPA